MAITTAQWVNKPKSETETHLVWKHARLLGCENTCPEWCIVWWCIRSVHSAHLLSRSCERAHIF